MTDTPPGRWQAYVRKDWASDNVELYVWVSAPHKPVRHFAVDMVWHEVDEFTRSELLKPLIVDTRHDIQDHCDFLRAVFDACWEVGMRPANHKDNTSELMAVRYHLEDMRKLVFKPLDAS